MTGLSLSNEEIALPAGAWAASVRKMIYLADRPLIGFTQGALRPYLFPVFTPQGFAVTSESPADHPHHQSIWVAADHVNLHVPAAGGVEVYSYNFYVNEVFQGRAPGRIEEQSFNATVHADHATIEQVMQWRGPREWGASQGREILLERRTTQIKVDPKDSVITLDICSQLGAPGHRVSIGPTRHAWFNLRVGPGMGQQHGGMLRQGSRAGRQGKADWHGCTAPVGAGHKATLVLAPDASQHGHDWYVSPWGVITANPCRNASLEIPEQGPPVELKARLLIADGSPSDDQIAAWLEP
jgi:hypothetical protein